jgi:hypothetical protein
MDYQAVLGPSEVLPERPFTDPANTEREADVMRAMLEHERDLARGWQAAGRNAPQQIVSNEKDEGGRRHLLVVPATEAFIRASDATAIGFFGHAREDVDHGILFGLEDDLIARMPSYGEVGLLSYYDVELFLPKGAYGNLILFSTPDVPEEWYRDEVHRRAVEVAPRHYHEVRLHKGHVSGPLLGGAQIEIERTKYLDFQNGDIWFGLRRFRPD